MKKLSLAVLLFFAWLVTLSCTTIAAFGMALSASVLIDCFLGNISWYEEDGIGLKAVQMLCGSTIGFILCMTLLDLIRDIAKKIIR